MASERDTGLEQVRAQVERQEYEQALAGYRALCEAEPYDPDLWLERASVAEAAGRTDDAIRALAHVLDLYDGTGLGEAVDVAERLLQLDPGHAAVRAVLERHVSGPLAAPHPGEAVPELVHDALPLIVPASDSIPVAVPIADSIPMPAPAAESVATPMPRPGSVSGPVGLPEEVEPRADHAEPHAAEMARTGRHRVVAHMIGTLSASPLIDLLDPPAIDFLGTAGQVRRYRRGESVVRQGDRGESLFLVLEGSVDVERYHPVLGTVVRLSTLSAGAFFGEQALVAGVPRSATVRARRHTAVLELGRDTVRDLGRMNDQVLVTLMRFFRTRLIGTLMATSPLFHPFSADERRDMVSRLRLRELPPQHIVLRQGRVSNGLYVVLIGTLIAFASDDSGRARKLGVLGPGDVFGEMSLIRGEPAMASVGTHTRAWILRLPRQDFDDMVAAHPEVLQRLADIAAIRRARNRGILDDA